MASRISSGMKDLAVDARAGSRPTPPPPGVRQRPMSARMADRAELERSHDGAARELFSGTAPPPSGGPDLSPSVRSRARPQSAQTTGGYRARRSEAPPKADHVLGPPGGADVRSSFAAWQVTSPYKPPNSCPQPLHFLALFE